jgi:iron complex transport system ATP-binding protein
MQSERGLRATAAHFTYDRTEVLHGISLGLAPGETLALAGPNGSGKTTLLKLFSGARRPSSGLATLDGAELSALSARDRARRIAVVSQHVDPSLTFSVESMVSMGRTAYRGLLQGASSSDDRRAIEQALDETDCTALLSRRFAELSGGEQQRVMLAMALAQETDYLLLDEPTVHLDLHHQHHLLELLRRLSAGRGIGILAVMHDLNLAALYFDRIAFLDRGRLIANGPPSDVLRQDGPLSIYRAPLRVVAHPQTGVPQVFLERNP